MRPQLAYTSRTISLIEHEKGRYVCPLFFSDPIGLPCPIDDPHWRKGGCTTMLASSIGARIRHQLDRKSTAYKELYKQRTATERFNAQEAALGIEQLSLRNGTAIANHRTNFPILPQNMP